jgi:hypothetical protein
MAAHSQPIPRLAFSDLDYQASNAEPYEILTEKMMERQVCRNIDGLRRRAAPKHTDSKTSGTTRTSTSTSVTPTRRISIKTRTFEKGNVGLILTIGHLHVTYKDYGGTH